MTETLSLALQLTLIGMSLVFGAIVLLWLVMLLLVQLTAEREPGADAPILAAGDERELQQRAAAAAVAIALAQAGDATSRPFPLPPTAFVSAWQAVTRSNKLRQRGPLRRM